jgi:hypothetical protein
MSSSLLTELQRRREAVTLPIVVQASRLPQGEEQAGRLHHNNGFVKVIFSACQSLSCAWSEQTDLQQKRTKTTKFESRPIRRLGAKLVWLGFSHAGSMDRNPITRDEHAPR